MKLFNIRKKKKRYMKKFKLKLMNRSAKYKRRRLMIRKH